MTIFPQKVNLTFNSAPAGATLYLDGIAHTTPFVYDTSSASTTRSQAPDQTIGGNTYTFASWSDGGAQTHTIVVPETDQTYTANFTPPRSRAAGFCAGEGGDAADQSDRRSRSPTPGAQTAGNTNIVAIGWNNATSNITSVTDTAGNTYQLAAPTTRGSRVSQAIYYAKNIKAAAAGTNTVTVTFNTATPYVDVRAAEYSGLDPVNPFDVTTSASGTGTSANSGTVTTTAANELIFGAGTTTGGFTTAGTELHHPHHHHPRRRHRRRPDRHRHRHLQRHRTPERPPPGSCRSPPSKPRRRHRRRHHPTDCRASPPPPEPSPAP